MASQCKVLCLFIFTNLYIFPVATATENNGSIFLVITKNSTFQPNMDDFPKATVYNSTSDRINLQCAVERDSSFLHQTDLETRVELCINGNTTVLDFCQTAFFDSDNDDNSFYLSMKLSNESQDTFYSSQDRLCEDVEDVRQELFNYEWILDRTLVSVYIRTCENKTQCLVS